MIIDLTECIEENMPVFPGDPKPKISEIRIEDYVIHSLFLGTHTGTHVDVQSHFIENGKTLDKYEISRFIGNAIVFSYPGKIPDKPDNVDFLLIYSGYKNCDLKLKESEITVDEAMEIVEKGYKLVGIDSPSIGNSEVHRFLLKNDILIVENLSNNLEKILNKVVKFTCLPLKLKGVDGAPVRAIAEF
ncbi:cyclase family protein [Acidianus manzaensis]|uniref:Cyclase n=1 Tax=Acidianus manzaensis TaxID=282676 RepID=A0A1W6K307_9CREN|nr:cyclase family protein [Acidianus manzaensis]ARM76909.1 hypothetical protein B6F84_13370 [Acidianus manzaensis]